VTPVWATPRGRFVGLFVQCRRAASTTGDDDSAGVDEGVDDADGIGPTLELGAAVGPDVSSPTVDGDGAKDD
jgi:hypothetical protein